MLRVIKYQKDDSLGKIIYKLNDPKENKRYIRIEKLSICLFLLISFSNLILRVIFLLFGESITNDQIDLINFVLASYEYGIILLMSIILLTLLF